VSRGPTGRAILGALGAAQLIDKHTEIEQLRVLVRRAVPMVTALPKPPPERLRLNVGRVASETNWLAQGAASAERVIRRFGLEPGGAILDWGCGSGRTLNWLLTRGTWAECYQGCDVDADAIAWLGSQGIANVKLCQPAPPLPYEEEKFAGLFSFSVLTHIEPAYHRSWYAELHRVLKPGATALLTVQGTPRGTAFYARPGHYKHVALVSEEFTRNALTGLFRVQKYTHRGFGQMDIFVARRL
jgi:SAM-dependent methyltransferase